MKQLRASIAWKLSRLAEHLDPDWQMALSGPSEISAPLQLYEKLTPPTYGHIPCNHASCPTCNPSLTWSASRLYRGATGTGSSDVTTTGASQ